MVRENAEGGDDKVFGTDLVVLDTARRQHTAVTPIRQVVQQARKPWYQAAVVQYLGNKKWRLGLIPADGGAAEWAENLPFNQVLSQLAKVEDSIKRIDHTSKEYRNYE